MIRLIEKDNEAIKPQVDVTREGRSYDFLGKSYARMLSSLDTTTVIHPDVEHNSKPENANSENIYVSRKIGRHPEHLIIPREKFPSAWVLFATIFHVNTPFWPLNYRYQVPNSWYENRNMD